MFIETFEAIKNLEMAWRRDVFRGRILFSEETNLALKNLYLSLLKTDLGCALDGKICIIGAKQEIEKILNEWRIPLLSQGVSFRMSPILGEEATKRFKELYG